MEKSVLERIPGWIIAIGGYVFSVVAFYPGFMSPDSIYQFEQSQANSYNDWHPPVMAYVWHLFSGFKSPAPMLLIQQAVLWTSLYLIYRGLDTQRYRNLVFLVGLFPWISNFSGVIWKDVWTTNLLLLVFALLFRFKAKLEQNTLLITVISLCLLLLAVSFRHNAFFSAAPFLFYISSLLAKHLGQGKRLLMVTTSLVMALFFLLGIMRAIDYFDYKVLETTKTYPENSFMIDDLANLSLVEGRSLIPGIPYQEVVLCKGYLSGWDPYSGKISCFQQQASWKDSGISNSSLMNVWLSKVLQNPLQYVHFRLINFSFYLRTPFEEPWYYWHTGINENRYDIEVSDNFIMRLNEVWVNNFAKWLPFFFSPFFWLTLTVYLFKPISGLAKNQRSLIRVLPLSSLFTFASVMIGGAGADIRYTYWSTLSSSICVILILIQKPRALLPNRSLISTKIGAIVLFGMISASTLGWILR